MKVAVSSVLIIVFIMFFVGGGIKIFSKDKKHDAVSAWKVAGYFVVIVLTSINLAQSIFTGTLTALDIAVMIVSVIEFVGNKIEYDKYYKKNK